MILEMLKNIAQDGWTRPIYYATTVDPNLYIGLEDYFSQEGIVYRIVPYNTEQAEQKVNTEQMFNNMMNEYQWGNIQDPNVYLDENTIRMASHFRILFSSLARNLAEEGKFDKAEQALDYSQKVIPNQSVPYNSSALGLAKGYFLIGKNEKAIEVYNIIAERAAKSLRWMNRLSPQDFRSALSEVETQLSVMQDVLSSYNKMDPELSKKYVQLFEDVAHRFYQSMRTSQAVRGSNL